MQQMSLNFICKKKPIRQIIIQSKVVYILLLVLSSDKYFTLIKILIYFSHRWQGQSLTGTVVIKKKQQQQKTVY